MRGDRPAPQKALGIHVFTPHAWRIDPGLMEELVFKRFPHARDRPFCAFRRAAVAVYPHARIDPNLLKFLCVCCLPRMRGDRPMKKGEGSFRRLPRMRGSTVTCIDTSLLTSLPHARDRRFYKLAILGPKVYPACAGIDPASGGRTPPGICLPRMRGDRPLLENTR